MAGQNPFHRGRLAIIDGTGPFADSEYDTATRHSFCRQMYGAVCPQIGDKLYLRGPSGDGYSTRKKAHQVVDWVMREHMVARGADIYLAGYSRGAWGVTMAAELLQRAGVEIRAMFLFDPVRMQAWSGGESVPTNVRRVYIARRLYNDARMDKYDWTTSVTDGSMNPVRKWWEGSSRNTQHIAGAERSFLGSHGAMGGVGWDGVIEDRACQPNVAEFMNHAFRAEALPLRVASFDFPSKFNGIKTDLDAARSRLSNNYDAARQGVSSGYQSAVSELHNLWRR